MKYPKIQSVYKRDPDNNLRTFLDEFSLPEFEILQHAEWEWTEKLDGTNIRIHTEGGNTTIGGRTDRSQIPALLMPRLDEIRARMESMDEMTLFGEGIGKKIQKVGHLYGDPDFVLFDVLCGGFWLERVDVEGHSTQDRSPRRSGRL